VAALATITCDALRERCRVVWQALLEHPFVREVAAGTLPLEKFRRYLEQDVLFLDDYARAIGLGIGRAADEEELRQLAEQLQLVVAHELAGERDLLRRVEDLAGRAEGPVVPAPVTTTYSGFLLATAVRGDALDLMVAMLPCAWSYAEIGLAHAGGVAAHPIYTDWLRFFAGAEYVDSIAARRAALDRAVGRAAPTRHAQLTELFTTAARLELAFWDMAYSEEDR
jgi:thiaminase/transcriptional activator TenA